MHVDPSPTRRESEQALLARARAGDDRAFALLFSRHEGLLAGRVRKGLPRKMDRRLSVADVVQEVRIVAFDRITEFKPQGDGALRRWLVRIAQNKVGEALRKHLGTAKRAAGKEVPPGQRTDTQGFAAIGPSPSEVAASAESRAAVRTALSTLPPDYRSVLSLVFNEQLSLREASERLDRSYEATKKLYGRALARFTRAMGGTPQGSTS